MHQQVISPQRLIEEAHHQGLRVLALEKRRWFAALGLIGAGILNRISPKTLSFESQTGFSKSSSLPIVKKLYWLAEIIGQKSEHLPLLSRLFNKILPFETLAIVEKVITPPGCSRHNTPGV
ncbi:MAG: hypothetical protein PHU92_03450 [Candidatus Shapirobacteria bacterium]|nr:hypothetical protein [Candidatus Shapirobacteria bacterium]